MLQSSKLNLKSRNYVLDFFVHLGVSEAEDVSYFQGVWMTPDTSSNAFVVIGGRGSEQSCVKYDVSGRSWNLPV